MRKRLALLGFLMLVSVGMAYAVNASDDLKELTAGVFGRTLMRNDVRIDEELIYTKLSPDQRAKAVEIALEDPQVQEILEGEDDYVITVANVYDLQEIEVGDRRGEITLIPKEGLALVEILIYNDYGEEFGLKVVKVPVDVLKEEVKEIEECPEVRKPKPTFGETEREGHIDLTQP